MLAVPKLMLTLRPVPADNTNPVITHDTPVRLAHNSSSIAALALVFLAKSKALSSVAGLTTAVEVTPCKAFSIIGTGLYTTGVGTAVAII
jgi:hypothetical protein